MTAYLLLIVSVIFTVYGLWYFIFNIYEVTYQVSFIKKINNNERLFEISIIPLNLIGNKVPFRKLDFDYELKQGENIIEIQKRKSNKDLFFIASKYEGKISFVLKTKLSLFSQRLDVDLAFLK